MNSVSADKNNNGLFNHKDSATFNRKAASREETVDDSPGRGKVDSEFLVIILFNFFI